MVILDSYAAILRAGQGGEEGEQEHHEVLHRQM